MSARFEYSVGEMVRIKTGAFQSFTGRVEEVDESRATIKVMVNIFARNEPVELRFVDAEKIHPEPDSGKALLICPTRSCRQHLLHRRLR